MRTIYKNPRELATCIKDLVDLYLENLMTYEKLEDKITRIANSNKESFYKDGNVHIKLSNIVDSTAIDIVKKILTDKQG